VSSKKQLQKEAAKIFERRYISMYAIVMCGGKQYKASPGEVLEVERLKGNPKDKVELEVLMTVSGDKVSVGKDAAATKVVGEIVEHGKQRKIIVYKYKPKKNVRKKKGHRQSFTRLKIAKF